MEVLAALALVIPEAFDVVVGLTPLAAVGLVALMLGAAATHVRRHEPQMVVVNLVLGAMAVFVAFERFGPHQL